MTRVLSIEEIRRWVNANFTRGDDPAKMMIERELPLKGFCRAVGVQPAHLTRFKQGQNGVIGARKLSLISRFITDWENGMLEFGGTRYTGRVLIHREKPKPRPPRMTLALTPDGPRLKPVPRPTPNGRIFLTAKAK